MKNTNSKNRLLFNQAKKHLVGGVNSPVRSFNYVNVEPISIKRGKGSKVYDYDGKEYIDYVLSYGALILGHAHPKVISNLQRSVRDGLGFGTTNYSEIELARLIQKAIPFIGKIRLVNSGTEAVMSSVRLARAYTGRDKVIKFKNAYHGHADYFLVKAGSGLASLNIPLSRGVPSDFIKYTIVIDYGDRDLIQDVFKRYAHQIAAVIVEPVGGNYGVVRPDEDFLKYLRKITKQNGTLLLFDEIITGFRFSFGSSADLFRVKPDLICLGKIIGGGLPIGAYGGREEIMDNLSPLGKVYQASTFGGNPIVMQAGITTLKVLYSQKKKYKLLEKLTRDLTQGIENAADKYNIDLKVRRYKTIFSLKFRDNKKFQYFYRIMLREGIFLAPSEFEANFLSFAHKKRDIDKTIYAVRRALGYIVRHSREVV